MYVREVRKICTSCGTRREDWDKDRFAFVAEFDQCPGCELIEMERKNVPDDAKGVRVYLKPNTGEDED